MGKIQDLYSTRVRPMRPAERLQLARLILDDLTSAERPADHRCMCPESFLNRSAL